MTESFRQRQNIFRRKNSLRCSSVTVFSKIEPLPACLISTATILFIFQQIGIHRVVLKLEAEDIIPVEIRVRIQVMEETKNERTLTLREKILSFIRSFLKKMISNLKDAIDLIRRHPF